MAKPVLNQEVSNEKAFKAELGEENSLTIYRQGGYRPIQIGYIDRNGVFYFDTKGEQVEIHPDHLPDLAKFVGANIDWTIIS